MRSGIPLTLDETLLKVEDQTQEALEKVLEEMKVRWEDDLQNRQKYLLEEIDPNYIRFNVGGIEHTTTFATLTNIQGTLLYKMMMGRYPIRLDDKKRIFLDRNGDYFRYVLDCMRDGKVTYPEDFFMKRRLEIEFVYFGLIKPREKKRTLSQNKKSLNQNKKWPGFLKIFTLGFWKGLFNKN